MAMELPTDLINRLKKATRAEAGLSDDVFAANDNHLPPLPPLSEVVAALDPSPPYLRCKNCHGRLLRGVESLFCIYCGRATEFDHPPISFKDSIAYRWLLESLDLDGSELVTPSMERSESNLWPSASEEEIRLSDLLDLKIQWPAEADKKDYGSSDKENEKRTSMSFAGVDLDNFFLKTNFEDLASTPEESSFARKNVEATEFQVDVPHHKVSFFEDVQPSESAIPSSDEKGGNSFTGWEADFQASNAIDQVVSLDHSEYHQEPSNLFDPVSRTAQELPSEMNLAFADNEFFKDEKRKTGSAVSPSSGDCMSEDLWATMNSTIPQQTLQPDENVPVTNSTTEDIFSNLAMEPNLFQVDAVPLDDPFAPTSSRANNDDDMLDDWNDFTSSTGIQPTAQNSTTGSPYQSSPFWGEISDSNIFSFDKDFKEMDMSSFAQVEPVSTSASKQPIQIKDSSLLEASFLDRVVASGSEATANGADQPAAAERDAKSQSNGKSNYVEELISKMHDLSFMVDDKLSVPRKSDGF